MLAHARGRRLRALRQPAEGCAYVGAIASAPAQFLRADQLSVAACRAPRAPYGPALGPHCPLLARKFAPDTVAIVHGLVLNCASRLNISRHCGC